MSFTRRIINFYQNLSYDFSIKENIEIMNPYNNNYVMDICTKFYDKFYDDTHPRRMILGINPGRFGAGITGIPFTDPINLEKYCGIENNLDKKPELSSEFIYYLIDRIGSVDQFYKHFYIGSVSPLGFIKNNKNLNYYDSPELLRTMKPIIIKNLIKQIGFGINSSTVYCLGQGQNFKYLKYLNNEIHLFKEIIPLPHPRWIMQYRRKQKEAIADEIISKLII